MPEKKQLKVVANISRGTTGARLSDPRDATEEVRVVQPVNLGSSGFEGQLARTTVARYRLDKYHLNRGDILVSLLDAPETPLRVSVLRETRLEGSLLVAGANVAIVRLTSERDFDHHYLACYLRSQAAARQLRSARAGTLQSYLNVVALGELLIPLLPIGEQKRVAELDLAYADYARETQQLLVAERHLLHAHFEQQFGGKGG